MRRRQLIKLSAGTLALGVSGGTVYWLRSGAPASELTIDAALARLDDEVLLGAETHGEWDLGQVLAHLAQSVEYSLLGYPEHKSELFKSTVGKAAFSAFSARGKMSHGLAEPIPGAPPLEPGGDVREGAARLRRALIGFRDASGPLAPHFAYGALSKAAYERAHVMHLRNHFEAITSLS